MKLRLIAVASIAGVLASPALAGPPAPTARAFLVQNAATGEVLARDADRQPLPIASITKLMTVLVALERAQLHDVVTVHSAALAGGSSVYLRPGERVPLRDLVEAALIQSANDAANALALHVTDGDMAAFVRLMNARARALGMRHTRFENATGLDVPGHVSSARDVTLLARVAMRHPLVRRIVALERSEIAGGRVLHTWNDLLGEYTPVFGIKTGHTSIAGWSQVAAARARGVTIYATILGSPTRAQRNADLRRLLAWGLSRYRAVRVVDDKRIYGRATTQYGRGRVALVARRSVERIVRVDRALVERVVGASVLALPVRRGQRVGEVRVYDRRRLVARAPLVAARSIRRPDATGRARWYAERALDNIGGWLT